MFLNESIGKAIARSLHSAGATIYAISRNTEKLKALEVELPGVKIITCDISDWTSARKVFQQDLPVVDYLVNNAAVIVTKDFLDHKKTDMVQ